MHILNYSSPVAYFSPILQTDMDSGVWRIVLEGLTFANVRTMTLSVGTPSTVTVSISCFSSNFQFGELTVQGNTNWYERLMFNFTGYSCD